MYNEISYSAHLGMQMDERAEEGNDDVLYCLLFLDLPAALFEVLKQVTARCVLLHHVDMLLVLKGCK